MKYRELAIKLVDADGIECTLSLKDGDIPIEEAKKRAAELVESAFVIYGNIMDGKDGKSEAKTN